MEAVLDSIQPRLGTWSAAELASVVWALAKLHHSPSEEWWSSFLAACEEVMQEGGPGGSVSVRAAGSLVTLLWAVTEMDQVGRGGPDRRPGLVVVQWMGWIMYSW